jgi:hypothetical protein
VSGVLRRFYALIDGPEAHRYGELLAEDLRFSILFSTGSEAATDFAGGRAEFDGYMAQRGTPGWAHHVLTEATDGAIETAYGQTARDGRVVATFVAAARVDADGRIDRYIVGRSPSVVFDG